MCPLWHHYAIGDTTPLIAAYPPTKNAVTRAAAQANVTALSTGPKVKSRLDPCASYLSDRVTFYGAPPANNALAPSRPLEKMRELIPLCGLDIEIAQTAQRSASGWYRARLPSAPHARLVLDYDKPVKGYEKGCYETAFCQLIRSVPVFGGYTPHSFTQETRSYELGTQALCRNWACSQRMIFSSCASRLRKRETSLNQAYWPRLKRYWLPCRLGRTQGC